MSGWRSGAIDSPDALRKASIILFTVTELRLKKVIFLEGSRDQFGLPHISGLYTV